MIVALARLPLARLGRTPRAWAGMAAWLLLGVGLAVAARADGMPNGADHVLIDGFGALLVPLLAYVVVGNAIGGQSLRGSVASTVAFGASPARSAGVTVVLAALVAAILSGVLGAAMAALAHGVDDPPVFHDTLTSAYAGALGGAAYAGLFALGATFGRHGLGRAAALLVDWLFGRGGAGVAALTARGNLRNLLGGVAPWGLDQRMSAAALVALAIVFALVAVARTRRA